jgi:hypoxanthine phosphoribosyltransferase
MLSTPDILRRTGGKPVKSIIYDEATIAARVEALGAEITDAYPDGELLVLGLLKGSFIFLSDLVRKIHRPIQVDFLLIWRREGLERDGTPRLRPGNPAGRQTYPAGRGYY